MVTIPTANSRTEMAEGTPFFELSQYRVAIPKYIELSNFVTEEDTMPDGSPKRYRLVFYSTVCHRGQYVHSGHYVSIVYDRQSEMFHHFILFL